MQLKIKRAARPIGHIHLERMSIEQLKPADYNPRTMTDRARTGLSNSIESFGLVQPIIYNKRTEHVVGGHQRLYDIIQKGATETDVVVVDLPEIKEKALNIALNHSGIAGDFETEKLESLLQEIGQDAPDYMELFNFEELIEEGYSDKNKELTEQDLSGSMKIVLEYTENEYLQVKEQLSKIAATPEQAVWELLGNG